MGSSSSQPTKEIKQTKDDRRFYSITWNAYQAFADKEAFHLDAQDVWVDLCLQFAEHINTKEEKYRKLVSWEGKKTIETNSLTNPDTMINELYDEVSKLSDAGKYFVKSQTGAHLLCLKLCTLKGLSNYLNIRANSIVQEKEGGWSSFSTSPKHEWETLISWLSEMVEMIDEPVIDAWFIEFKNVIEKLEEPDFSLTACLAKSPGKYHEKCVNGWLRVFQPFSQGSVNVECPKRSYISVAVQTPSGEKHLEGGIGRDCKPFVKLI
jgi:hypothetical protein